MARNGTLGPLQRGNQRYDGSITYLRYSIAIANHWMPRHCLRPPGCRLGLGAQASLWRSHFGRANRASVERTRPHEQDR